MIKNYGCISLHPVVPEFGTKLHSLCEHVPTTHPKAHRLNFPHNCRLRTYQCCTPVRQPTFQSSGFPTPCGFSCNLSWNPLQLFDFTQGSLQLALLLHFSAFSCQTRNGFGTNRGTAQSVVSIYTTYLFILPQGVTVFVVHNYLAKYSSSSTASSGESYTNSRAKSSPYMTKLSTRLSKKFTSESSNCWSTYLVKFVV